MIKRLLAVFILAAGLLQTQSLVLFAAGSGETTVMMQGFHWTSWKTAPWWGELGRRAGELSGAGINLVWLPPSSDSLAPEGYLPRKLNVQDSNYGTAAQLGAAVRALHARGIRVIADIVVNHRVGTKGWADFAAPAWGPDSVCSDDEWGQGEGAPDTGKGFHAGRDIDHTKAYVRDSIKGWLKGLQDGPGYDGWRYDYARGLAPGYLLGYNRATAPSFAVAEIWDDLDLNNTNAHRQASVDWMDAVNGEIKVFDFTTKGVLQAALGSGEYWRLADANGRPSGLIGWWPANAVTFIDNHDTGPSPGGKLKDKGWPFPSDKVQAGYAYILTHPGVPCVYWPHFFDWGLKEPITALLKVRRAAGINSASPVSILKAEQGLYAAVIGGRAALKLGDRPWNPGPGWSLAAEGPFYSVWTK
ncbi:MAG: alpha-amylase [Elusimicrobia bacterium GWA2_61_42]|nr:MAG: alpha-amylase [Elusimicrobia bacterium GWA2_61_42]OGR75317.1 MAG: alpha-amylase [Elusimicrobia bacterium GWC2_61_25]